MIIGHRKDADATALYNNATRSSKQWSGFHKDTDNSTSGVSMATRRALYDLVTSMSKMEKRYFKLQASLHMRTATHDYVQLFDAIGTVEDYSDAAFDKALHSTQSSVETQKYLYEAILRALHLYHRDQSPEAMLHALLHQADILYNRKLYEQASQLLEKAKLIAEKHQRYGSLLDVLKAEYRLILAGQHDPETLGRDIDELFAGMKRCIAMEESSVVYGELNARLFYYAHTTASIPRTQQHSDVYKEIINTSAMRDYSKALSTQAKIMYWNNLALYHDHQRDYRGKLECYRTILDVLASGGLAEEDTQRFYRSTLHNICSAACSIHEYEIFFMYYSKLLDAAEPSPKKAGHAHYIQALALGARVRIVRGEFLQAADEIRKIELSIKAGAHVRQGIHSYILYLGFYSMFGTGDYTSALVYLDKLLRDRSTESVRPDLYYTARLLEILVHYELGNIQIVSSLVRSTAKFLRSRNHLHKAEASVLRFFRSASRKGANTAAALDKFHRELLPLIDDRFEVALLALFNFLQWTESKRTGRQYVDIVRDKNP